MECLRALTDAICSKLAELERQPQLKRSDNLYQLIVNDPKHLYLGRVIDFSLIAIVLRREPGDC